MRRTLLHGLFLVWMLGTSAAAPAGSGPSWVRFSGPLTRVTFQHGERTVHHLRLELLTPRRSGVARGGKDAVVRVVNAAGGETEQYTVTNAMVTGDVSMYLAGHGSAALVLYFRGAPPDGPKQIDKPLTATVLFSDHSGNIDVTGTWHSQPLRPTP